MNKEEATIQAGHERLFHLAAFFTDHGWVMPPTLRFDADKRRWEGAFTGETPPVFVKLHTNTAAVQLRESWVHWWENLPSLYPDFKHALNESVVEEGGPYIAHWGTGPTEYGEGDVAVHAIRNGVRGLLKRAKELRAALKAKMFSKIYGSTKMPITPEEEVLSLRLDAVFKALTPAKKSDQIDAEIAASFPDPDKPSWLNKKSLEKMVQDEIPVLGDDALPPDALDITPVKDAVTGMSKPNANGNVYPKSLTDIFGKEKAAEMKAKEDAAFAEIDANLEAAQKGLAEIIEEMKAKGVTIDQKALKELEMQFGEAKVKHELLSVLHGEQSSIPGVPVTFKHDSPVLSKLPDDEEPDALKGCANFLIQAQAAAEADIAEKLNASEFGKHFKVEVQEDAEDILLIEPSAKALAFSKLDFKELEMKLLNELAAYSLQVKVEPQPSVDPNVVALKVTFDEKKEAVAHLKSTMASTLAALSNYGVNLTHSALSNFLSGKHSGLFPVCSPEQMTHAVGKLKQQFKEAAKGYQQLVKKQFASMQEAANKLAAELLKELDAKEKKPKKKKG